MNNPSTCDSGYDSSFSTVSGPGQPPSSRGNSNIDDQVDRYIRDQRVATLINTSTDHSHSANPALSQTTSNTNTLPPNPSHIRTQRTIADHHRAIAEHHLANHNDTDSDQPPPLIPDSDTNEYDATDADIPLPFTRRYDDDQTTNAHPTSTPAIQLPARVHTDDEQNTLCRQFTYRHSYYAPTLTAHRYLTIFDSRTATHDSDSTHTYPSDPDSEDDIPGYWPEHQPETPPNPNSPHTQP